MRLIAHRGNTKGPNHLRENSPGYLAEALSQGYYVEMDIRVINGDVWLGHDTPQYLLTDKTLLNSDKVYVHAKNIPALEYMLRKYPSTTVFFHDKDHATLTSKNEIWTYPGRELTTSSICVMPEWIDGLDWNSKVYSEGYKVIGICSDYLDGK